MNETREIVVSFKTKLSEKQFMNVIESFVTASPCGEIISAEEVMCFSNRTDKIGDIEEDVTSSTVYVPEEEGHTDDFDAAHAQEWMKMHPHGYYNNEHDYGEYCEDD